MELILIIQGQSTGVTNCPTMPGTEEFLRGFTGGGISVPKQENRKKPVTVTVPGTGTSWRKTRWPDCWPRREGKIVRGEAAFMWESTLEHKFLCLLQGKCIFFFLAVSFKIQIALASLIYLFDDQWTIWIRKLCRPGLKWAGGADEGYTEGHNAESRDCLFPKCPS